MKKFKKSLEIIETNPIKIIFKSTYSWASCLSASQEEKFQHYSLLNNSLNYLKLKKIALFCKFSAPLPKNFSYLSKKKELRNYQQRDMEFLSKLESAAIFSEMRTGKTPIALMTFNRWAIKKLLIIVPAILQQQWQQSVEDWLLEPAYVVTHLDKKQRYNFYQRLFEENEKWIIIVSKDTFKTDSVFFKKKDDKSFCVIIDEAHFLRNYQSQQSKSIYNLCYFPYKLVLTGTPIVNHYSDIFGILKFLKPETYFSYWKFVKYYFYVPLSKYKKGGKTYKIFRIKDFKSKQLQQQLQEKIAQFSVNRRQREVLPWLLPTVFQKEYLLMEDEQQNAYLQWKAKWRKYQPLEALAKLKTLTLYPHALGVKSLGSKINYLINFFQEKKEQSIIVFSTRSETFLEPLAELAKKKEIEVGLIIGKTSYREREKFINKFQVGGLNILLCNIQSAGLGLNFSRAETIIFADRSYSPADNEQAEARFLPTTSSGISQVRLVIDLICKGTVDERILQLLKKKYDIIKILNTSPDALFL